MRFDMPVWKERVDVHETQPVEVDGVAAPAWIPMCVQLAAALVAGASAFHLPYTAGLAAGMKILHAGREYLVKAVSEPVPYRVMRADVEAL
jgi:hypothetical protein